ncbi:MAG: hydantoinase/oxoprolinase family protein [Gemmatimonadetes bacterium]|nr:hydantoinase/oxoprolinase family protein [Gemmatimonadota bacterium]
MSIVAVDTGGTFTDVVAWRGQELAALKVPSTPDDPARAVLEGIRRVLSQLVPVPAPTPTPGVSGPAASGTDTAGTTNFLLIHGSTVATNALLERRGARIALVTNRGFEDVLEIGRQNRPQLYALLGERLPPLVARADRHGIAGRLGPGGEEEEPLEDGELQDLLHRLRGAEAVAIALLHSYAHPGHERRVAAALESLRVPLSVSSQLLPEYREYARVATTAVNAYVAPRVESYLGRLEQDAGAERVRIMGSAGGALAIGRARREPVHTVLSGPAGGVMGALFLARQAGFEDIIAFDMGGTSTDVSLCPGRPLQTRDFQIAGLPVAVPLLDIHTVGAGGGSIACLDAGGALRVGPESAGAEPGPLCYGQGGMDVTVTDAHVWLGRLPAAGFLGGQRRLEPERIEAPLRHLAQQLGTTADAAAEGVLAVADAAMEGALRLISVERGFDPADFTLVAFGGAAPLHAVGLAERMGIARLLVPPAPGVLSAYGMLAAPVRKDAARTVLLGAEQAAPDRMAAEFAALEATALAAMESEGIRAAAVSLRRTVDARYRGQSYELNVAAEAWQDTFHAAHRARYGYARPDADLEAVTLRVEALGPAPRPPLPRLEPAASAVAPAAGVADVVFRGKRVRTSLFARPELQAGHLVEGPAVIMEYSATTWLPPGWRAQVHDTGSLIVTRAPPAAS